MKSLQCIKTDILYEAVNAGLLSHRRPAYPTSTDCEISAFKKTIDLGFLDWC